MSSKRTEVFAKSIAGLSTGGRAAGPTIVTPVKAREEDVLLFHSRAYVNFVKESSKEEGGLLDSGDTPSFKGVYEASLYPVGSTLNGVESILNGKFDHFFNPVGGLHHARRSRAGGFCVFNDAAIAVCRLLRDRSFDHVAYVDIDAHHGDGVFYAFESDSRVIVADLHEDGRFLYPGTGDVSETGLQRAKGTKLNVPMQPGDGDEEFRRAFDTVVEFLRGFNPAFILFQCGADSLGGDPIAQLSYTERAHAYAALRLHDLAHEVCQGRILAMGGGGYDPSNVSRAWMAVTKELAGMA